MLHARLQRPLTVIALLAMLALTLLPAIGRLHLEGVQTKGDGRVAVPLAPAFGLICTTRGLAYSPQAAAVEAAAGIVFEPQPPIPESPGHRDSDCDYCALSAQVVSPAFFPLPMLHPTVHLKSEATDGIAHSSHHPCGLGSRGPPA